MAELKLPSNWSSISIMTQSTGAHQACRKGAVVRSTCYCDNINHAWSLLRNTTILNLLHPFSFLSSILKKSDRQTVGRCMSLPDHNLGDMSASNSTIPDCAANDIWRQHEPQIRDLYQKKTRKEVQAEMEKNGFPKKP